MAYESNMISFVGNLTGDPEMRFTSGGTAVCNFRVASNRRWTDRNGNQQEETTFLTVNCWRDMAENVAESLSKGDRAVVLGRIRTRSYENRDGQTVYVTEIEADEVAPSLRWARADVDRGRSGSGRSGGGGGFDADTPPPPEDDVPF